MLKRWVKIALLLALSSYALMFISFQVVPQLSAAWTAKNYLNSLVAGDYARASQYLLHDSHISTIRAQHQSLREKNVFVTGYKNIRVDADDGWITGQATITLSEGGVERAYRVYISFGGNRFYPLVGGLQSIDASDHLAEWLGNK